MKITYKILSMATLAIAMLGSCSDFDEVNTNPSAAGDDAVHPDYSLNKSFYEAQMDPDIAERVFVYNWASITRIVGENTMGVTARYNVNSTTVCTPILQIGLKALPRLLSLQTRTREKTSMK